MHEHEEGDVTEHTELREDATPAKSEGARTPLASGERAEASPRRDRMPASLPHEGASLTPAQGPDVGSEAVPVPVESTSPTYVYALGQIVPRFPTLAVEKEVAQVAGQDAVAGTDRQALQSLLAEPSNRYLARQMCWVFTIEGLETFILHPRVPGDVDLLVESIRATPRRTDVDVVIGELGPIAPPEMCNAMMVPIVFFDHVYSFDVDSLLGAIPRPDDVEEDEWEAATHEVFSRVTQMNDNAGATDADRALNYLSVRYSGIYEKAAERFAANSSLTAVEVRPSRLSGTRNIVDVIFTYVDRSTDVTDKLFTRVDVTEEFPFLVNKLQPFFERAT